MRVVIVSEDCTKKYFQFGVTPPETRGGVRQEEKCELKRAAPIQSHYYRGKNTARQYLNSLLNVKKKWEMSLEKHMFFQTIFNENFNISFDAPCTDKCSTCMSLANENNDERDKTLKHNLQIE
ncbi:hypothetical protein PR048_015589 [Dryococelus australis]|uniref:Uncharacterized protein n=1 Tax=Dryococelus australis TaxID=614101 RepID=A0ABQ9HHN8_9NEOP|nr:hypothetical protein PR048_015589 [Dryococelus australis]